VTCRAVNAGAERCEILKTPAQATASRDALAKAIYERLFDRLVASVNTALRPASHASHATTADAPSTGHSRQPSGAKDLFIGLLDIFGSEVFETNGFAQLLINYANDKLQHYFTQAAIAMVHALYVAEGACSTDGCVGSAGPRCRPHKARDHYTR
jgi:myosin heavy subunit